MPPYHGVARFNKQLSMVMQSSGKEMKALGRVIFPCFAATILHPLASQRIPFTDALLSIKNIVYFHLIAQYQYHTQAKIEYMEDSLAEIDYHKDVLSRFCASKSTKMVSEASKKQLTLDNPEKWEGDPGWENHCAAPKCRHVVEENMHIKSDIAQHLVDQSDINFVKMHLLKHLSDNMRLLGNL